MRVQLLGSDPHFMAANARRVVKHRPAGIDINFGCPAPTVFRHPGGSALLGEPELLHAIVSAVRRAVPIGMPVSAKMRLGNRDESRMIECAQAIADAGADELVVHARTRVHGYRPPAYWDRVAHIRAAVPIRVVANGEVWSLADAQRCLAESGCDALMLGRGLVSDPGLALALRGAAEPTWADLLPLLHLYGQLIAPRVAPRHRGGRIKQWLNMLRKRHPQAQMAYQTVRTLRDADDILASLPLAQAAAAADPVADPATHLATV